MNQSWGHAHPILIFSMHAGQGVVIGKDSTNAQIVAQIVPALNNNDNCNVILAYSQVKYLVLGQYSSCF